VLAGHTEEEVNYVNAPAMADERGIRVAETKEPRARDFTDLVRVTVEGGGARERVVGTVFGSRHRPHLLEAWGQRFNVQLDPHLALFRYRDLPGMIGRVGTVFGDHGVNIVSAAVGRLPGDERGRDGLAVMVLTTDVAVPNDVVAQIVQADGFVDGRTVSL
jgi:D-3-phosphoglycerate dehydrogenase / 2-oxoglutarate reductase